MKNTDKHTDADSNEKFASRSDKDFYKVPEGYFEELSSNISDKIAAPNNTVNESVFSSIFKTRYLIPVAGVAIIAIAFIVLPFDGSDNTINQTEITTLSIEESGIVDDIEESLIVESYILETLDVPEETSTDIEDYLINNNIELSQIINEL